MPNAKRFKSIVGEKKEKKKKKMPSTAMPSIIRMPTESVSPHPDNPRFHDDANVAMIMSSYREFGELGPIVVWGGKNYVIAGNGRLEAARRLGKKTIGVIRADHLSAAQAREFLLMDNRTSDSSSWDKERLGDLLQSLSDAGSSLEMTGFSPAEIAPLLKPTMVPDAFPEYDEGVDTEHRCPKCGYEWSGNG